MSQWSECNNLCDGEQFRTAACVQIDSGHHVSPIHNDQKPKNEYQMCNAGCVVELVQFHFLNQSIIQFLYFYKLSFFSYVIFRWEIQRTSHYRGQIIDDKYCENLPKESLERVCNTHEYPKWQFGDESAVSI